MKTDNALALACVPALLNELLQSRRMSAPQRLPMAQPSGHRVLCPTWNSVIQLSIASTAVLIATFTVWSLEMLQQ